MSRNHKNNHYHYAEKFERRSERSSGRSALAITPVVFMILVLLAFGCISTTFSAFITSNEAITTSNGLRVAIRTKPVITESVTAADQEEELVEATEATEGDSILEQAVSYIDTHPKTLITTGANPDLADTGANVDVAETGYDTVGIHTNATISGSWETTELSTSDGNHYTGNIYFKGKSSGNYEMGMQINGNWKVFGGYWIRSGTAYNTAWGSGNNDQIVPTTTSTTTYIRGAVDFYKEYSGNPRLMITQTTLSAISSTVTVGSTSLTSGGTTTVGGSSSGGSGSYTNVTYLVRQGSTSGTDVTAATLGSSTGTTFTAPSVASSTTYYIYRTVTDANLGTTATSSYKTITVSPPTNCTLSASPTSTTLNIGETQSVSISSAYHNSGAISISSSNTGVATVSTSSVTGTSGTFTITAVAPGSATITVACGAGHTSSTSAKISVSVRTPSISSVSYSPSSVSVGESTSAPTVSISNINSDSEVSYTFSAYSSAGTYATINSSTGVLTGRTVTSSTQYVNVSATISYNGKSYTVSSSSAATRGAFTVYAYYLDGFASNKWGTNGTMLVYDSSSSTWKAEISLTGSTTYNGGANDTGFKVFRTSDDYYYGYGSLTMSSTTTSHTLWSDSGNNTNVGLTTTFTGTYIFEMSNVNNESGKGSVDIKIYFPHSVTFNANGHGTTPSTQYVKYGGTASEPAISATGWNFGGWYSDSGLNTAYNFSTAVTSNITLYAKWTASTTTVTLNKQSGSGGTSSVTATYGSAMPSATMPTRTGYTFGGYYSGTSGGGTQYYTSSGSSARTWNQTASTYTLYAKWTPTNYTITLTPNSGTVSDANWSSSGTNYTRSYTIESDAITLPTPSRTGYRFDGWFDNSSLTGTAVTRVASGSYGDKAYYAKWTEITYSVTLDQTCTGASTAPVLKSSWGTGLTGISRNVNNKTTFNYNVTSAEITLPTKDDFTTRPVVGGETYIFSGWFTGANGSGTRVYSIPGGSTENKTYYAYWTAPIVVTFYNDVTGATIDTQYLGRGESATPPSNPTLAGFSFLGWYDSSGNVTTAYNNVTANVNVYAHFTINAPAATFNVTCSPASLSGNGTSGYPLTVEYGSLLTGTGTITAGQYAAGSLPVFSWSVNDGAYSAAASTTTFSDPDSMDTSTTRPNTAYGGSLNVGTYQLKIKASYTGVYSRITRESNVTTLTMYYYAVNSPISSFALSPQQRIFNESADITSAIADLVAELSTSVPSDYHAVVRQFQHTSGTTYDYTDIVDMEVEDLDTSGTTRTFSTNIAPFINSNGVKYFDLQIRYSDDETIDSASRVTSATSSVYTTVGTNETSATRPLYFKNNTATTIGANRLMALYFDGGSLKYQTAQPVSGLTNVYRFNLPSSVEEVYFTISDSAKEYRLPAVSGSTLVYDTSYFSCYTTSAIDISNGEMAYLASDISGAIAGAMGDL